MNETQSRTLILQNQSVVGLHVKDSLLNLLTFLGLEARRNPQKALTMIVLHQLQVCINIQCGIVKMHFVFCLLHMKKESDSLSFLLLMSACVVLAYCAW